MNNSSRSGADASVSPPVDCLDIQSSCPASIPHPSGRCVDALSCEYQEGEVTWTYTCEQGRWTANGNCGVLGCAPVPPLAERCTNPQSDGLSASRIQIGPTTLSESFRTFQSNEKVELVWGPQGSPMLEYRIQLSGDNLEQVNCIDFEARLTTDGEMDSRLKTGLRVRCGDTLRIFSIVESQVICENREVELELEVEIKGVGTSSASLIVQGGNCLG